MPDSGSPMTRSIGLSGVLRWLIVIAAVITLGAAVAEGRYGVAIALFAFILVAVILGLRAQSARRGAGPPSPM